MKRTFIIILLSLISFSTQAHTYVDNSVLASGNIVKLQITYSGICRLTYEQIAALGIYPPHVRVLGYGGNLIEQDFRQLHYDDVPAIPFYMHTGADGVFSSGDYILFYVQGPLGWKWNGASYERTRNCYANYGCYFLSDNAGEQRIMDKGESILSSTFFDVYTHTALQLHEEEKINLIDISGVSGGGREWYGEGIAPGNSLNIPFTFADADTTQNLTCRVYAAATSSEATKLTVKVGDQTASCSFAQREDHIPATTGKAVLTPVASGSSIPVKLTYPSSTYATKAYLNYIEMHVPSTLRLRNNSLIIRNTDYVGQSIPSRYHLLGADKATQVWNITDPVQAYVVDTTWQGDTLCWMGKNNTPQVFIAVRTNTSNYSTAASRGKVYNQNLHQDIRGKQHIIVTPELFRGAAEKLKQVHEQHNPNEKWCVVSDEDVYNEFSSGTPDASAIRWMMKYLWDNFQNTDEAPKSVLLFGDGSFDNRQILTTSGVPYLLTYQAQNSTNEPKAYATDDYFGWLTDNGGILGNTWSDSYASMQIGVGRLPISTYEQGEQVVNKIATYLKNANPGNWKQQLCFLADDGDKGQHVQSVELATDAIRNTAPEYVIRKIYLDSYVQEKSASGERYPLAEKDYYHLLNTGVLLMDYAGHGSPNNICSEMFLTRKVVESMTNTNLGLWALATCNFARFDQTELSTAEIAVLNTQGAAIGVISADRTAYVSPNETLNKHLCTYLFTRQSDGTYPYTIGEALRLAKNKMSGIEGKLPYVLLGDPSLKLSYPEPYQLLISHMPDTLHALDLVTIEGYVADEHLDTVDFNGQVSIQVFDKEQTLVTRSNDSPSDPGITYKDFPYQLFNGQSYVTDGKFTIEFRMPKDIRYFIDNARLTLYAVGEDSIGPAEAIGYNENFKIGGSSPIYIEDNEGPSIKLYLNTPFFNEGEEVNPTPHFYAELYDKNGINTAGSGIGHDLQLTVDKDAKQTYVLNSYYTSIDGSYQNGLVSYPMSSLADGNHSLTFRAWDMLNNASSKTLGFSVSSDLGADLKQVIVYPNPVFNQGELTIQISHDRPDDTMDIHLTFYDMMGHTIWSTTRRLYGVDGEASVSFNMAQTNLPTGVYIYQFRIQNSTQSSAPHSGRIIVY